MNESEHLPGCNQQHSSRQRCSVPAPEPTVLNDAASGSVDAPSSRIPQVVALVGLILLATTIAVIGLLVSRSDGEDGEFVFTSDLPHIARPPGAVELRSEEGCPVEGPWWPPCRTMTFGTDRPYRETIDELRSVLEDEGWSASIEYHDYSLHMLDYRNLMCVLYYEDRFHLLPATATATEERTHDVMIEVVIDQCGANPRA